MDDRAGAQTRSGRRKLRKIPLRAILSWGIIVGCTAVNVWLFLGGRARLRECRAGIEQAIEMREEAADLRAQANEVAMTALGTVSNLSQQFQCNNVRRLAQDCQRKGK